MPYTFNNAQEKYFNNFTLDYAEYAMYNKARQIFEVLEQYYAQREKDFADYIKVKPEDLKYKIDDFIKNFQDQYEKNNADNYPYIDDITSSLHKLKDSKNLLSEEDYLKYYTTLVEEIFDRKRVAKTKLNPKRIKQVAIATESLMQYLKYITEKYGIPNANEMIQDLYEALITGRSLNSSIAQFKKLGKITKDELKYLTSFLQAIRDGFNPKKVDGG